MEKVLVSFDERLLKRIDRAAREMRMSRSALLAELAADGLDKKLAPGADPEVAEALDQLEELFKRAPTGTDSTAEMDPRRSGCPGRSFAEVEVQNSRPRHRPRR